MSITIFIILLTVLSSFAGWQNHELFDKLKLNPYMVVQKKEFYRVLSHAFLHADTMHLIFNMITLFFFGRVLENELSIYFGNSHLLYVILYILGALISSVPCILKHKNDHWYNSIGASGAVSAVLFAAIFFQPMMGLYLYLIPIPIPGFLFGIGYLAYSQYMSRKNMDNIGHDAHFTGAIFGFLFPLVLKPELFQVFIYKIVN